MSDYDEMVYMVYMTNNYQHYHTIGSPQDIVNKHTGFGGHEGATACSKLLHPHTRGGLEKPTYMCMYMDNVCMYIHAICA